jgi:hypothetical protein
LLLLSSNRLLCLSLVTGFATMQTGQLQRAIFTFPLLIFGFYVLL